MTFERAPIWRRALAGLIDQLPAAAVAVATALAVAEVPYQPEAGWFWSEWLLKIWLDHPEQFIAPAAVFGAVTLLWQFGWEAMMGRTVGGRLLSLEVIDRQGQPITWVHAGRRLIGGILNLATLGLGWCWMWVDPEGRGLHDRIGGSWVVADDRD